MTTTTPHTDTGDPEHRSPAPRPPASRIFRRIVVGYDPSERAERAFHSAVEVAAALRAEVHVVTAFSDGPDGATAITPQRRRTEHVLERAAERIRFPGARSHQHAIPARPAAAIVGVAEETDADLVVVGNRGATGVGRVLGSVAAAVVAQAPCDVLVVKTD